LRLEIVRGPVVARRVAVAVLAAGLVLAGCSSSSKSSSPTTVAPAATSTTSAPAPGGARPHVTVIARDFSFQMPATVPSGYVDVTLENHGKQDHQLQIVELGPTRFDDFRAAAVKTDIGAVKPGTVFVGGPNDAAPGKSTTATVKLDPGLYAITCFIPGKDGKPHAAHGMIGQFQALPSSTTVNVAPVATSKIILGDFTFTLPTPFTGRGVVDVTNQGSEVHELNIFRLAAGVTEKQAETALLATTPPAGPPPVLEVTGTVGLSPRQDAWLDLDLKPGNYILVCFFPDPKKNNIPHVLEGMIKEFTIS